MISKKIIVLVVIMISLVSTLISAQTSDKKPLVMIIATGGTIANTPGGRLSIETVLQETPEITAIADMAVHDYIRVGSASITIQNRIDLANIITQELKNNP